MKYGKMTFSEKEVGVIHGIFQAILKMDEQDAMNITGNIGYEMMEELYYKIRHKMGDNKE